MQRASPISTRKQQQVSSDTSSLTRGRSYTESQYRYLIYTRHYGDDENVVWETVRVAQDGNNVVVYRRRVTDDGTSLGPTEDGPIAVQDVVCRTLSYKRRPRAKTATRTDSDSD